MDAPNNEKIMRAGYIQVPRAALDYGEDKSPEILAAIINLYILADRKRWEPFDASQRFLSKRWGLTKGRVSRLLIDLRELRIIDIEKGTRDRPQRLNVHRGADHLLDHPVDHILDHPNRATASPPKSRTDHPIDHPVDHLLDQSTKGTTREQLENTPLGPPKGGKPEKEDKVKICFDKLSEMRSAHRGSRAQPLKLTKNRRRQLAGRLREYSEDEIIAAWRWWHTSTSELAITLRQSWDLDTFLRPSKHDRYQTEALKEEHQDDTPEERGGYQPPTEEEEEIDRRRWFEAKAEKARQEEEETFRRGNELLVLLGKPPRPRLKVLEGSKA